MERIVGARNFKARDSGVKIGNNVRSVARQNWGSEPWLIEVGDDTLMSFDVTFLTHDGSISACAPYFKDNSKVSKFGKIKIGKGCFIGCKTTIMPGVTIGNHCVTAACSVITKDIPDGEVWGGVPAKFICTTEELAKKTEQNSQTEEQRELRDYVNKMREKK